MKNKHRFFRMINHIIIYPTNSCINVTYNKKTQSLNEGMFYFINNSKVNIDIIKELDDMHSDFIELNQNDVSNIIKIMNHLYCKSEKQEKKEDYLFSIEVDSLTKELFNEIKKEDNYKIKILKLVCLLSKCKDPQSLFNSLVMSATVLFSIKVRRVIECDISKKWSLSLIAREFNLSEISIRKKLSRENTSFYKILLDVRMEFAVFFLLKNEFQIGFISNMIGMSSSSHFIKTFQVYYGLTPKRFLMQHINNV